MLKGIYKGSNGSINAGKEMFKSEKD